MILEMVALNRMYAVFALCLLAIAVISSVNGKCGFPNAGATKGVCLVRKAREVKMRRVPSLDNCKQTCCASVKSTTQTTQCWALRYITKGTCTLFIARNRYAMYGKYFTRFCDTSVQFICSRGRRNKRCRRKINPKYRWCLNSDGKGVNKFNARSRKHCENQCLRDRKCQALAYFPRNQCSMYFTKYSRDLEPLKTRHCDRSQYLFKYIFNPRPISLSINRGLSTG